MFKQLENWMLSSGTAPAMMRRQLRKVVRSVGLFAAVGNGFYNASKYGAFDQPNQPEHIPIMQAVLKRMCDSLAIRVEVHGNIPTSHALWVSNHVSWVDIPVIASVAPVFFLSKAEVATWPVIGTLARAGGTLFIQRGSGDSGSVASQIADFLRQKLPVLFFPEGTTTNGRDVKRIHGKLLVAAIETGTPVQPLALCYQGPDGRLDTVMPYIDDMTFGEHIQGVLARSQVRAHLMPLEPIPTVGMEIHTLTDILQERMREGLKALQAKVLVPDMPQIASSNTSVGVAP